MCLPKIEDKETRRCSNIRHIKEAVEENPELGLRALYLIMTDGLPTNRDIEVFLVWGWLGNLGLNAQEKADLLLGMEIKERPYDFYGIRVLQGLSDKLTDLEVFTKLYNVMTHKSTRITALLEDGSGHIMLCAKCAARPDESPEGWDSGTYWKFLLAPAPGFSSAENQVSHPWHIGQYDS